MLINYPHPFREEIGDALSYNPELISEKETLRYFRQQALTALNSYQKHRLDQTCLTTYGMENWKFTLNTKWFDVSKNFHLYLETKNHLQRGNYHASGSIKK